MTAYNIDEVAQSILSSARSIAVIGFSADPTRDSNDVARFLLARGYRVLGVNPKLAGREVNGIPVYGTLAEVPEPIDMVDVFRRIEDLEPVVRAAVELRIEKSIRSIWLQLGLRHPKAEAYARAQGLKVVSDRCPKIELAKTRIEST